MARLTISGGWGKETREYLIYYRGLGFLSVLRFGSFLLPFPPPPHLLSASCLSFSVFQCRSSSLLKGSLTRNFRLQVFFMNQCPPGPQVFHWSHFEFFRKFAEIFANYCLSPVSTTPVINWSAMSTTPAKNLLPVSLTPAINLCHGFSVIAGVVDTGEQFITGDNGTGNNFVAGDNDTGDNFVAGDNDTTPVNNYRR